MKKYELTAETKILNGVTLHRIKALIDVRNGVKAGDLGGWVESEDNLSHEGSCWIADEAVVYDNGAVRDFAVVRGAATVSGEAVICGRARVFGKATVKGRARMQDDAIAYDGAIIMGCATIKDNGHVYEDAVIKGESVIDGITHIYCNTVVCGYSTSTPAQGNIYRKLQMARVQLQERGIKKSGVNKYAGYSYFELGDILPVINQILDGIGICSVVTFGKETATLTMIDIDNPSDTIVFTSPMAGATLKGAHDIQNLGAVETYQRRYLYMVALEVVESDYFDSVQGKGGGGEQTHEIPPDMQVEINRKIREIATAKSMKIKDVVDSVTERIGKPFDAMDATDGVRALAILQTDLGQSQHEYREG